ncbi:ABC transporter ATP-binding protein [uncultured Alsobacter sp.]|uniref:ABC transporter ATP-binding protein n=1 Tax=uncultured Alsobacter sp. TaxID=1748258 RepID=UPI0025F93606|nr:ABC transporter ATP-binding protein [uncultured Alsobacter sp.]
MSSPSAPVVSRLGALRHIPAVVRLVYEASPLLAVSSIALRTVRALLPVAILFLAKLILDEVVAQARGPSPGGIAAWWAAGKLDRLALLVGAEFVLGAASDVLARASSLVDSLLAERYSNHASVRLMRHAATLDLEQFEDNDQQDRLDRARRQVTGRTTLLSQLFAQAQDLLTALTLAAGLVVYAPWLLPLLLVALIPALAGELHFNAQGYRLNYFRTPERRNLDYLRYLGSSLETAKEVKLFGLGDFLVRRFAGYADAMYEANKGLAVRRTLWGGALALVASLTYYAAYAAIIWNTVSGHFSIGDLSFLAASFLRLRTLLEGLLLGFAQIAGQALYLEDLLSFFAIRPRVRSPEAPLPFPQPIRSGFVFEDVGFRYPNAGGWAVRHLDLRIPVGEVLALVGENGAGKTTIVKLLARLYDPTEGRILLDGRDLRDYDLGALRQGVGVIFQDFVRFHFTAGENIGVGLVGEMEDAEKVRDAAQRSLADKVVARLPLGYDNPLGRRFDQGVDLSGGEWQKIAIARAYMRDAQVLVLDEPTAALDARSEAEVFQRFRDLSQGRTVVLISHRFSTVRMADRVVVLADGRVAEEGTHEALMALRGRYAELFELQAAGYR